MTASKSYFFCGIGGSGMLPLASILADHGHKVAGSDRSMDQGRHSSKFDWLTARGMALFPQDGSGVTSNDQILVASAAVEKTVPDVMRAEELGCTRMTRAELLSQLFNATPQSIAIGGTSGKSTVTAMIGWIAHDLGLDPTIMNGAVMKNFAGADAPFASARVGKGDLFISEVDESDRSIALFRPTVAVINNISHDHRPMEELRELFADFARVARIGVYNADDRETATLLDPLGLPGAIRFGTDETADFRAIDIIEEPLSVRFTLLAGGERHDVMLRVPGRHNVENALAAIAAAHAIGVPAGAAVRAIAGYSGIKRRFEVVGTINDITVIDDFGHNPEKIAATLKTLKAFPGRLLLFFQPHGYGPLRVMGEELTAMFRELLGPDDVLLFSDPCYFGGTVDRSVGSEAVIDPLKAAGFHAELIPTREACGDRLVELARPGDRIVIMGARDDSLPLFAAEVLGRV